MIFEYLTQFSNNLICRRSMSNNFWVVLKLIAYLFPIITMKIILICFLSKVCFFFHFSFIVVGIDFALKHEWQVCVSVVVLAHISQVPEELPTISSLKFFYLWTYFLYLMSFFLISKIVLIYKWFVLIIVW